jgi:hypothetical protein
MIGWQVAAHCYMTYSHVCLSNSADVQLLSEYSCSCNATTALHRTCFLCWLLHLQRAWWSNNAAIASATAIILMRSALLVLCEFAVTAAVADASLPTCFLQLLCFLQACCCAHCECTSCLDL